MDSGSISRSVSSCAIVWLTVLVNVCAAQSASDNASINSALKSKGLSTKQFEQLTNFIRPSNTEDKWRQTDWIPSIRGGRKMGVAKNKPLFIWAMNGDPLGCV